MSIRRIGGFHPSVQTASLIEAQRRIQAVEKHAGTEDTELMTEEQALEALNARHQAELEAVEAERAQRAREVEELRAKLLLSDGYETAPRELVDLKGGATDPGSLPSAEAGVGKPGVSLAHLARASVYESVSRAERAAAEQATASFVEGGAGAVGQAEVDELDELDGLEEEAYSDPGADSFLASLEDIENLEEGGAGFDEPSANAFVASLDDIALLVPEQGTGDVSPGVLESVAGEPSMLVAEEASVVVAESAVLPFDDKAE